MRARPGPIRARGGSSAVGERGSEAGHGAVRGLCRRRPRAGGGSAADGHVGGAQLAPRALLIM